MANQEKKPKPLLKSLTSSGSLLAFENLDRNPAAERDSLQSAIKATTTNKKELQS